MKIENIVNASIRLIRDLGPIEVACLMAVGCILSQFYFGFLKPQGDSLRWENAYNRALVQYADTNHDGIIINAEKDAFLVEALKDKRIMMMPPGVPRYEDGTKVPITTLTEWIEDYTPPSE
jgi:hypothetical protein